MSDKRMRLKAEARVRELEAENAKLLAALDSALAKAQQAEQETDRLRRMLRAWCGSGEE